MTKVHGVISKRVLSSHSGWQLYFVANAVKSTMTKAIYKIQQLTGGCSKSQKVRVHGDNSREHGGNGGRRAWCWKCAHSSQHRRSLGPSPPVMGREVSHAWDASEASSCPILRYSTLAVYDNSSSAEQWEAPQRLLSRSRPGLVPTGAVRLPRFSSAGLNDFLHNSGKALHGRPSVWRQESLRTLSPFM